jgi:hypothetical protein
MPGIRSTWQKAINPDDIDEMDISSFIRRPLRGVGIWGGYSQYVAGQSRQTTNISAQIGMGGCFVPSPDARGMMLVQRAPEWLTNVAGAATNPTQTLTNGNNATTPQEAVGIPPAGADPGQQVINTQSVYAALAQWTYISEVLRGRNGMVKTKFRMDIAPGSNIEIRNLGELFISQTATDSLQLGMVGTVQRVGLTLDAERSAGNTVFHLTHLRSVAENADARTSVDIHPLYPSQTPYTGAPLVDSFLFPSNQP